MHWSKLRSEYVEIFHNALDHIQVDTLEDISIVLVNFMHREDNEEFPQIIPDRIAAEINAFNSLNEAQKTQYIQAQQQTRTSVTEITSRTAPAPGSDVLVLSEQQWLAGFQQDLMNESNLEFEGLSIMILQENLYFHQVNIANPSNRPISQVVQEPIDQIIITLDQYLQIPIDHREEALRSITINT